MRTSNGNQFLSPFGDNPIKAIDTQYRGFLFRSRLEARYAVLFDWLKIKWEYEKEGYVVNGVPYLPDFWLPYYKIHFEVKGQPPTENELNLARGLRELTKQAVAIFHGTPGDNEGMVYCWDIKNSAGHGGAGEFRMSLSGDEWCGLTFYCREWNDGDRTFFVDDSWNDTLQVHDCEKIWAAFRDAVTAAKQARFEHGADPRPSWLR